MSGFVDFVLHSDRHLLSFIQAYGAWVYALLFGIVFAETGFVVTPFLPGDSLLFAAGTLCATGSLSTTRIVLLLTFAAFAGNTVNYAVGRAIGARLFTASDHRGTWHRLINRDHLTRAHEFFERYGGKAIVLGRFVPIVRTFVPFVAGAGTMSWVPFVIYNLMGASAWVFICVGSGLAFGGLTVVKAHFSAITLGIVGVSLLPMAVEYVRHAWRRGDGDERA